MVLTILEARVDPQRATSLESSYRGLAAEEKPTGFIQSHLLRSASEPNVWRIQTLWRDREALEVMRSQGTPAGVVLFRQIGAEPQLAIFDVVVDMNVKSHLGDR